MNNKKVVVRTLDIGGDKTLKYFNFAKELNPFLGYRAIRLSLDRIDVFVTQLRALIRASEFGNLAIMFPMIATVDEFLQAKAIFDKTFLEVKQEFVNVKDDIKVGIMIEIPAAAMIADQLAKYVDFFSIGTNDLIQYSMAADRMNEKVTHLYQPLNPSILKLIKLTIDGAHKHNK
ncbi:putative phosphoenolpyruvate-protein phosphotransferase [Chlamydia trachomatis]|nr:putative phosphoenolpyruvate-protein phosphotransferase [Chlamydia trachomatis]